MTPTHSSQDPYVTYEPEWLEIRAKWVTAQALDTTAEWDSFVSLLNNALADSELPEGYKALYYLLRAYRSDDLARDLEMGKEWSRITIESGLVEGKE
jgi:hypothetical protein